MWLGREIWIFHDDLLAKASLLLAWVGYFVWSLNRLASCDYVWGGVPDKSQGFIESFDCAFTGSTGYISFLASTTSLSLNQSHCGLQESISGAPSASCAEGMSPTRSGGGDPAACI